MEENYQNQSEIGSEKQTSFFVELGIYP